MTTINGTDSLIIINETDFFGVNVIDFLKALDNIDGLTDIKYKIVDGRVVMVFNIRKEKCSNKIIAVPFFKKNHKSNDFYAYVFENNYDSWRMYKLDDFKKRLTLKYPIKFIRSCSLPGDQCMGEIFEILPCSDILEIINRRETTISIRKNSEEYDYVIDYMGGKCRVFIGLAIDKDSIFEVKAPIGKSYASISSFCTCGGMSSVFYFMIKSANYQNINISDLTDEWGWSEAFKNALCDYTEGIILK
jgi:hypothetical protein